MEDLFLYNSSLRFFQVPQLPLTVPDADQRHGEVSVPPAPTLEGSPQDLQRPLVPLQRPSDVTAQLLDGREAVDTAGQVPVLGTLPSLGYLEIRREVLIGRVALAKLEGAETEAVLGHGDGPGARS